MADNLEETFLNIGDGNGAGEDLCPLVGGDEKLAKIPSDFWQSPSVTGTSQVDGYKANSKHR